MSTFLIAYDLHTPGQKHSQITEYITNNFTYTKILNTTWLISTSQNSHDLYNKLKQFINGNDKIFIVKLESGMYRDATWFGFTKEIEDWIQKTL